MENYDLTSDRGVSPAMITLFNFMQEKRGKEVLYEPIAPCHEKLHNFVQNLYRKLLIINLRGPALNVFKIVI